MKTDFLSFLDHLRRRGKKDVFTSTQNRLTAIYSGLLMIFLILFIVVVYALLYFVILKNQEHELRTMAGQEARVIENYLFSNNHRSLQESPAGVDHFFYYVVDPEGELIMGDEVFHGLRSEILSLVQGWIPDRNDIRQEKLQIKNSTWDHKGERMARHEIHLPPSQHDVHLMITGQPIMVKGHLFGTLYVGKDISFAYQLFKWLLIVLVGLAVVFAGIAFYISNLMSKKAMGPISNAFDRQREFVADASHELRTPLSVLLSSIETMEMTVDREDDFTSRVLFNMKDEVKRMTALVSDLLTLARSDSHIVESRSELFDLRPHAEKAVESLKTFAASKQILLGLSAPANIMVHGHPERIKQLIYILLDNGIKYTQAGGNVQLYLSNEENQLCIKVQDTGIGIKPEDHDQIFSRFYRVDKTRSRQMGSHGLGLAIAKWIVDNHNGSIKVDSDIGKGSTFTIRIPFSDKTGDKA